MAVRYVLFQCMNISPCTNVYMVTGRAMTYNLGEITDPPQNQFIEHYAMVFQFAQNMGIELEIGPYAGTKECHDVSCGMYLTLNGDIYPCPGYEGIHNVLGSAKRNSIKEIWENSSHGGHPQSICPPKIGTHFPPDFERQIEKCLAANKQRYDEVFQAICEGLGVSRKS
jgi:MoaA/NifB/PqqE/SkfB family radical SAM enzyme